MDATRSRRTRDLARRLWYASHRQRRFARHMGFDRLPSVPLSLPAEAPQMFVGADEDFIADNGKRGQHMLAERVASQQLVLRAG
jgi:hypothetical protein